MNPKDLRRQVETLVKAEWRRVEASKSPAASPEDFVSWSYSISPVIPAAWPPDGKGLLYYYVYAYGLNLRRLADAQLTAAPWGRVKVDVTGRTAPSLEILTKQIEKIGPQGVRPLMAEEVAVFKTEDAVEEELFKLSRQTGFGRTENPAIKRYYRLWCETNGTVVEQIRTRHQPFFKWVGCE
jgi:hypothetical protein